MKFLNRLCKRLLNFATRRHGSERLREEIEAHLAALTEENVRAGMAPEEAARQARLKFGAVEAVRADYHAEAGVPFLEDVARDGRYALRVLWKSPAFTLVAVLVLALGIGASTAIWSIVDAVLLRPLPFPDAQRLVLLKEHDPADPTATGNLADYLDWQAAQRSFIGLALVYPKALSLSSPDQVPERMVGAFITANYLPLLGVSPILGRNFNTQDDTPGGPQTVLLSEALWRRRFGANPAVLGQRAFFNGVAREVVGVLPSRAMDITPLVAHLPEAQFFVPLGNERKNPDLLERGAHYNFIILGRLKDVVTSTLADQEVRNMARELARRYPQTNRDVQAEVQTLQEAMTAPYRFSLYVLSSMVVLVLLIACVNVANLQLARANARQHELSIRAALGAARSRLVGQLLTESLLLGLLGGTAGALLAFWLLAGIVAYSPTDALRFHEARLNGVGFGVALFFSLASGLFIGAWPAWRITTPSALAAALQSDNTRGSSGEASQRRFRSALVVAQIAMAVMLLSGVGLLLRSLLQAQNAPLGFQADGVLTASIDLPEARYGSSQKVALFFTELLEQVRTLPGVTIAATSFASPFNHQEMIAPLHVTGTPPAPSGKTPTVLRNIVSADFFAVLRMPILRGQSFSTLSASEQANAVLIDERAAQQFFSGQDPLGQCIDNDGDGPPFTVVGVVPHVANDSPDVQSPVEHMGQIYFCSVSQPTHFAKLLLRVPAGDPLALVEPLRHLVTTLDPELPVAAAATMDEKVAASHVARRWLVTLLSAFAGVTLLLASIGLYGMMALSIGQRTRELGIRMALGASRANVLRLVLGEGVILTSMGVMVGLSGALIVGRLLAQMLYVVQAGDPVTLSLVTATMTATALVACLLPSRQAISVNLTVALRHE